MCLSFAQASWLDTLVRSATGRDAKDATFATILGPAAMVAMSPLISAIERWRGQAGFGMAMRPAAEELRPLTAAKQSLLTPRDLAPR
jgi:hypothetical protein